jgi:hypothetical protein
LKRAALSPLTVTLSLALLVQLVGYMSAVASEARGDSCGGAWYLTSALLAAASLMCLVVCAWRRKRRDALIVVLSVCIIGGEVIGRGRLWETRLNVFADLASRSDGVVEAAWEYCRRNGRPPRTISDLVSVLGSRPHTGLAKYPDYKILNGAFADEWGICVECDVGIFRHDMLLYWPSEHYPAEIEGGEVVRLGRWAFVIDMD